MLIWILKIGWVSLGVTVLSLTQYRAMLLTLESLYSDCHETGLVEGSEDTDVDVGFLKTRLRI